MNGDDEIQARRDEAVKWRLALAGAMDAYERAVDAPHVTGQIQQELKAIRSAHERVMEAKWKVYWLRWCDEMDEGRYREETDVHG